VGGGKGKKSNRKKAHECADNELNARLSHGNREPSQVHKRVGRFKGKREAYVTIETSILPGNDVQ